MHRDDVIDALRSLVGTWTGRGEGAFPTIDSFAYREETVITTRDGVDGIHFEQRAWKALPDGGEETSHWESGFFLVDDAGQVDLLNAQESRRVEVLAGEMGGESGDWELVLESRVHAYDPRVVATTRAYRVTGDRMEVTVMMATEKTPPLTRHLHAILERR